MDSRVYDKKVACFIHNLNLDTWKTEILENLINELQKANLIELLDFIFINNLGNKLDENMFENISDKIIIKNYSDDIKEYEKVTLNSMHSFSKINLDYKILYLHSKGCSYPRDFPKNKNIQSWVNFMLYCLVENADSCIELLENNECVGCQVLYPRKYSNIFPKHFSGNFWWATSSYIASISSVENLKTYYDAEWYIFRNNPNYINIYGFPTEDSINYLFLRDKYENIVKKNLLYYKENGNFVKSNVDFVKVGFNTNEIYNIDGISIQLISIVNAIVDKVISKKYTMPIKNDILFLSSFCTIDDSFCSIKKMVDLESINLYLQKYKIILIAEEDAHIEISQAYYGIIGENISDVTESLKNCAEHKKYILIDDNIFLNKICTEDPIPNIQKMLYVTYKINGYPFQKNLKEHMYKVKENLHIDLNNSGDKYNISYTHSLTQKSIKNIELTNEILQHIQENLSDDYYEIYKKMEE